MQKILQKILLKQMLKELDSLESSYFELTSYFPELKNKEFRDDLNKHQCNYVKLYWNNLANYKKEEPISTIGIKLDMNIESLNLTSSVNNSLKNAGIIKIGQLVQVNDTFLLKLAEIGRKRLGQIKKSLGCLSLRLEMTEKDGVDIVKYNVKR